MTGSENIEDIEFPAIDFLETRYHPVEINGLVKKMTSKRRAFFNVGREKNQLSALIGEPPKRDEVYKMLSINGGFSTVGIINYIATREPIEELNVSTFRIGKNHFKTLLNLHSRKLLGHCNFITSSSQQEIDAKQEKYDYFTYIRNSCKKVGWRLKIFNNHSKILLMKTKENHYVVETSSNLNENPKTEHFSWENDKELYEWYHELFMELLK